MAYDKGQKIGKEAREKDSLIDDLIAKNVAMEEELLKLKSKQMPRQRRETARNYSRTDREGESGSNTRNERGPKPSKSGTM